MTGGGNDLKKREKSNNYLYKTSRFIESYIKKIILKTKRKSLDQCNSNTSHRCHLLWRKLTFARYAKITGGGFRANRFALFNSKLRLRATNCGAILIEFAVCMPILIILLFYIHDLMKIKQYYSQTEFVVQQMANILQNLAKKKAAEGKTIGYNDLCHAASLAFLSVYPGTTMYSTNEGSYRHGLIHCPFVCIYCVEGLSGGKAKCKWGKAITSTTNKTLPWINYRNITTNQQWSTVTYNSSEVTASSIYPTLKIEEGKLKIILEASLYWGSAMCNTEGKKASTNRQAFGLNFVNPKHFSSLYFHSVIIFTPNNGFPEVRPDS